MGVADHPDILAARAELHGDDRFGNQLGSERADDVHSEYHVGLRVGDEFYEAARVAECARPGVGHEREGAGTVGDAFDLELLLGLPHPGDLRRRVDPPGDRVEIDVRLLACDALGHRHALFLRLVREHGAAHHVADRPDAGEIRAAMLVDSDEAALELEADCFGVQALGVGDAADRDDEPIENRALSLAFGVGVFDRDALFRLHARNLHAELDLQTLLAEDLPGFPGDLFVGRTEKDRQRLEDRHLRPEPAPHASHFQPDHARADDAEALRHLGNGERTVVAEDQLLVECRPRQSAGTRAGGDDDVARREGLSAHGDFAAFGPGFDEAPAAVEEGDLVLLEEIGDAVVARLHHLVLAPEHLDEVELQALHAHAVLGEAVPGLLEVLRGLQQCLGRNTADVGAGSAQGGLPVGALPVVDTGGLQAELGGADRGDVATRTAADYDYIKR